MQNKFHLIKIYFKLIGTIKRNVSYALRLSYAYPGSRSLFLILSHDMPIDIKRECNMSIKPQVYDPKNLRI